MLKRAFGYAGDEIWAAEAEGMRMLRGIRMPRTTFGCPRGYSDTLYKLLHGGYSDAGKCIRMPTTQKSRTTMKLKRNSK